MGEQLRFSAVPLLSVSFSRAGTSSRSHSHRLGGLTGSSTGTVVAERREAGSRKSSRNGPAELCLRISFPSHQPAEKLSLILNEWKSSQTLLLVCQHPAVLGNAWLCAQGVVMWEQASQHETERHSLGLGVAM